jgi:hypothetical protein
MNVLSEMTKLFVSRPAAGASKQEFSAWFEAKARLHAYLASQGGADAAHEATLAESAHRKSLTYAA